MRNKMLDTTWGIEAALADQCSTTTNNAFISKKICEGMPGPNDTRTHDQVHCCILCIFVFAAVFLACCCLFGFLLHCQVMQHLRDLMKDKVLLVCGAAVTNDLRSMITLASDLKNELELPFRAKHTPTLQEFLANCTYFLRSASGAAPVTGDAAAKHVYHGVEEAQGGPCRQDSALAPGRAACPAFGCAAVSGDSRCRQCCFFFEI